MSVFWMIVRFALPWILAGGTLAAAYGLVTKRAYDRGVVDTKAAMQRVIERKASEGRVDRDAIKVLPDKEIDCELLAMRGEKC